MITISLKMIACPSLQPIDERCLHTARVRNTVSDMQFTGVSTPHGSSCQPI